VNEQELVAAIQAVLEDKKGKDVETIDITGKTVLADWFVIASGTSVTHNRTLADEVMRRTAMEHLKPLRVEGYDTARWILLDYGDVVIHIFHETERSFYNLERLWQASRQGMEVEREKNDRHQGGRI
jgi:ribosome-associated protein